MVNFGASKNTGKPARFPSIALKSHFRPTFWIEKCESKVTTAARAVPYFYGSAFTLLMDLNRTWAWAPFRDPRSRMCRRMATGNIVRVNRQDRDWPSSRRWLRGRPRRRLAPAPSRAHDLPHKTDGRAAPRFRRFRFTGRGSLAMIGGKIIPLPIGTPRRISRAWKSAPRSRRARYSRSCS
jgi:hypothetical protein